MLLTTTPWDRQGRYCCYQWTDELSQHTPYQKRVCGRAGPRMKPSFSFSVWCVSHNPLVQSSCFLWCCLNDIFASHSSPTSQLPLPRLASAYSVLDQSLSLPSQNMSSCNFLPRIFASVPTSWWAPTTPHHCKLKTLWVSPPRWDLSALKPTEQSMHCSIGISVLVSFPLLFFIPLKTTRIYSYF